jgi:hypothetical protein
MRWRALLVGMLLLAGALAGCIGGEDGEDVETASDDEQMDEAEEGQSNPQAGTNATDANATAQLTVERTWFNGTVESASVAGGYVCNPTNCDNAFQFEVGEDAQAVVVEAAWEEDTAGYLEAQGANCESVAVVVQQCGPFDSTDGESPLALTFTDDVGEAAGEWTADYFADGQTPTEVEVTMVASVVTDGELPDGYTALDAAG